MIAKQKRIFHAGELQQRHNQRDTKQNNEKLRKGKVTQNTTRKTNTESQKTQRKKSNDKTWTITDKLGDATGS